MLTKPVEDLTLEEINKELAFAGIDREYKRMDHAQKALLKAIERGDVKTANDEGKPKRTRSAWDSKSDQGFTWVESPWEGRRVFVPLGAATIVAEARVDGDDKAETHFQVKLKKNKEIRYYPKHSVRFKPVDDGYRDQYEHDTTVRTESGAVSINNGDGLAQELKGMTHLEIKAVAKDNGLAEQWEIWEAKELNKGMFRMNVGNMLRAKIRRGERVTVFGKDYM